MAARKTIFEKQRIERSGRRAETLAAIYLRLRGYRILARRYKTRLGEIDIIAARGGVIIMIEVKYRMALGACHDSLSRAGAGRIRSAADIYIARHTHAQDKGVRFDALLFYGARPSLRRVEHLIAAF